MKIYGFDELKLYEPNLISITGSGLTNKSIFANKLIISIHDKLKKNNDNINFYLTIFTYDLFQTYRNNLYNLTIYRSFEKLEDFYLMKNYYLKKNKKLDIEILLIDINITSRTFERNIYLKKIFENYKKLNLIIIYYSYLLYTTNIFTCDYYLLVHDGFSSNLKRIYKYFFEKYNNTYENFIKTFNYITRNDGVMITNEKYKGKFIKINKLYDEQEERRKLKIADKNYNSLSDESNIRFF